MGALRELKLGPWELDLGDRKVLGTTVLAIWLSYVASLVVYRLWLSPIASIPGPKLAALTQWYERYYEFKSPGGQFMFQCRKLHEKYGPVLRIGPNEVVIQDSDFYHTLYAQSRAWDKPDYLKYRFNLPMALQPTPEHQVHRIRRAALNPFFSKRKISSLAPLLQQMMDTLCDRIDQEYKKTGKPLTLNYAFGCYTADAVVTVCFDTSYNWIDAKDFRCSFVEAAEDLANGVHFTTQFTSLGRILYALPESALGTIDPKIKLNLDFHAEVGKHITQVFESPRSKGESMTMFQTLRESDLPSEELTLRRLQQESGGLVGAGVHTVKWSLAVASFHIINTPHIYKRLRAELKEAIPDVNDIPPWETLEQLPYLTACIEEGLRLSYGVSQRLHRKSDTMHLQYGKHAIPPGTVVGMDVYSIHHDETIFPDSFSYIPERWLDNPRAPNGKPLNNYMLAFGRGTRSCLGINLAYAELYIAMANVYRKFAFELYETDRTAVDCYRDMFVPFPKPGTQGVRVLVK